MLCRVLLKYATAWSYMLRVQAFCICRSRSFSSGGIRGDGATPSSSPESTSGASLLPLAWLALVTRGMPALPRSRPRPGLPTFYSKRFG